MCTLLTFPFDEVPKLRPVLAWTVAVLILFLILTLPAYFIFLRVFRRVHAELSGFLKDLAQRHALARLERRTRLDNRTEEFRKNSHLKRVLTGAHALWKKTVAAIIRELKAWRKVLATTEKSLRRLASMLPDLQGGLASLNKPWPKQLLAVPNPDDLPGQTGSLRVAKLKLVSSGIILACVMFVNTGMLSQIIREIMSSNARFGAVPLYVVFALILTMIEASWGFVHGAASARHSADGEGHKIRVLPTVAVLIAVGLGFLEGYFYSLIASKEESFAIPLTSYNVPQTDFFFFWGFSLVMALFALGKVFFDSYATVREGTPLTEIRREVKRTAKLAGQWKDMVGEVEGTVRDTRGEVATVDSRIASLLGGGEPPAEGATQRAATGIARLEAEILSLSQNAPAWAGVFKEELTKTEVLQLIHSAGLWLCLTIIAGALMIVTGWRVVTPRRGGLAFSLGPSVIFAIALVGAGLLLGAREVIVQDSATPELVAGNPRRSRWAGIALGAVLLSAYIVGLLEIDIPHGWVLEWVCNFLTGVFLVAAGHQLAPLLAVTGLWLEHVGHWILVTAEFIYEVVARILLGLIVLIEYIFLILAYPLVIAFGRPKAESEE